MITKSILRRSAAAVLVTMIVAPPLTVSAIADIGRPVIDALTTAAASSEDDLLAAVTRAVVADPAAATDIANTARALRPQLTERIDAAVAAALTAGEIELTPAAGPLAGLALAPLLAGGGAAAGVAALAGATGGGGGDGGGDSAPGADIAPPADAPPAAAPPVGPATIDPETANQPGLVAINAPHAYARGLSGDGITVAVVDSGLDATHPEFVGRVADGGFDFVAGTGLPTDPNGHGTFVAGIIAAAKDAVGIHGVAHGAQVLPVRIADGAGAIALPDATLAAAIDHVVASGAAISNNSWGTRFANPSGRIIDALPLASRSFYLATRPAQMVAYVGAANSGLVHVWAAGNDGLPNVSIQAGAPRYFPELQGRWLAVAATDPGGAIADYSNRCGLAAAWCLAAPGSSIISTFPGAAYARGSGTSFAAPHVSGALAIVMQLFPELDPEVVVARLLETANRSGIYSDAAIYGQGFLDLEAATRPVGDIAVVTGDTVAGQAFALADTSIDLGPAFGDGLAAALSGTSMAVFDKHHATFMVDLQPFVTLAGDSFDLADAVDRLGRRPGAGDRTVPLAGGQLAMRFSAADSITGDADRSLDSVSFTTSVAPATELQVAFNAATADVLGLATSVDPALLSAPGAFGSPYLDFAGGGYSVTTSTRLGPSSSLAAASLVGDAGEGGPVAANAVQWQTNTGNLRLGLQAGALWESGTILGADSTGALAIDGASTTTFGGASATVSLTDSVSLVGSLFAGVSNVDPGDTSLFTDIGPVVSNTFSVGVIGQGVFDRRDTLGFAISQPLRVADGRATLSLPTGRDRNGAIFSENFSAGLAPTGREINAEVFYERPLGSTSSIAASTMVRSQPGHVRDAPLEGVALARFRHRF